MRLLVALPALLSALAVCAPAIAQDDIDAIKVDPAHHQVVFENDQVRVVRWTIAPGDKTLNHSHPASLVIATSDYDGIVTTPGAAPTEVHWKAGTAVWREAGIHIVENTGKEPMTGIIVEPKRPGSVRPAGSADPVVVDAKHQKVAFENDQIRVIREWQQPHGAFPMHGHPDNVQVLLTDIHARLSTGTGKPEIVTGKAGEVRWRTATQHAGKNLEVMPIEQLVIEMKGTPGVQTASN